MAVWEALSVPLPALDALGEEAMDCVLLLHLVAALVRLAASIVRVGEGLPALGLAVPLKLTRPDALGTRGVALKVSEALGLPDTLPTPALTVTAADVLGLPAAGVGVDCPLASGVALPPPAVPVTMGVCVPHEVPLPPQPAVALAVGVAAPVGVASEETTEVPLAQPDWDRARGEGESLPRRTEAVRKGEKEAVMSDVAVAHIVAVPLTERVLALVALARCENESLEEVLAGREGRADMESEEDCIAAAV